MKYKYRSTMKILIFSLTLNSCVTQVDNDSFHFGSGLLNLPYQESILIYPDTSQSEQRLIFSEKFILPDAKEYLIQKENEKVKMNKKIEIDKIPELNIEKPTIMDIIAYAFQDLRRGDSQKAIEKINNILNVLERNRSKTLSEDLGVSPYREAHLVLAMALLHDGNNSDAIAILEKLILFSSAWANAYLVLSDYYLDRNSFELAKLVALRGIDLASPNHPSLYVSLARAYRGKKEYIQARQAINMGISLFPKNNELISWLGVLEFDEKNYIQGCQLMQKAFEQENENSALAHNYAVCLLQANQLEQANQIMRIAIANNPSNAKLYYTNGIIEEARKHYFSAQKSWQTFLSLANQEEFNYKLVKFKLSQMKMTEKTLEEKQELPDSP
ncbi:tetratricopeptide repeat protein [Fluviispira multicolorata]|uniref:Tetratricopeptide repeat protein n=1 Tax=Fluviispira multicolorata TaxID=2654512 RepID=A0A833JET5_9BACT|nr:tetratricopeptide repeat protein [Fluviispira multicolorata]KAB8030670.1 tetratricopeptide repeat protein [Fluviispira multicolorata]